MKLWVLGLNHRTAPVEIRERIAFPHEVLPRALHDLAGCPGVSEALILSTCNRVELAFTTEDTSNPDDGLSQFWSESHRIDRNSIAPYLYRYEDRDAIRHIFRVASSLDSMIVGEPQILGQLKSAYNIAKAAGTLRGFLETVVTRAFSVAKRVRSETEIGSSAVSVSYAAVQLARDIFGSLAQKRVMLIGAGKMSELAARHLLRAGVMEVLVTNRTRSRAEALAAMVHGRVVEYNEFTSVLPQADIVITSSGAPEYILRKPEMRRIVDARKNRPIFLIDIAVPRNVDPAVNEIDNIFLYDIDDLQKVVDKNLRGRLDEAQEADKIVAEEVERLERWLLGRQAGPLIAAVQQQLEALRNAELERVRGRLGPLTPQQEEALEALTKGIVNKIAHGPISELRKQAGNANGTAIVDTIRRMFRLQD